MTVWEARRLRKGDQVLLEDGKQVTLLIVPWGFPWLNPCATTDGGWDIHWTRILRRVPAGAPPAAEGSR